MRLTMFALGVGLLAALIASLQTVAVAAPPVRTLFARETAPIYATTADHRTIVGGVTPGTPVQISGKAKGGFQAFTLDAWSEAGNDSILFAAPGQRIVLATLSSDAAHPNIISTEKDEYGNTWNKVALAGFIKASELTPNQEAIWARAKALYGARCSACHALHDPNEFTADQWPTVLKTMTKNAALQAEQAALLTQYLQTHAKGENGG